MNPVPPILRMCRADPPQVKGRLHLLLPALISVAPAPPLALASALMTCHARSVTPLSIYRLLPGGAGQQWARPLAQLLLLPLLLILLLLLPLRPCHLFTLPLTLHAGAIIDSPPLLSPPSLPSGEAGSCIRVTDLTSNSSRGSVPGSA